MKLHIYAQVYNHDHAFIVGNKEALENLRNAIQAAIDDTELNCTAFAADGEWYEIKVYREEDEAYWHNSALPYTDKNAIGLSDEPNEIGPWELFKNRQQKSNNGA